MQIYISLQVINSSLKTLLLGINWLNKYKIDMLSNTRKLKFTQKRCIIKINVINA